MVQHHTLSILIVASPCSSATAGLAGLGLQKTLGLDQSGNPIGETKFDLGDLGEVEGIPSLGETPIGHLPEGVSAFAKAVIRHCDVW